VTEVNELGIAELPLASTPMGCLGRAGEVARATVSLASEERSSYVTGSELCVDGGWTAQ
jgi:NAD(P)-dependent dehydrogenase (short-subunit alcohol dehydrogenase family)